MLYCKISLKLGNDFETEFGLKMLISKYNKEFRSDNLTQMKLFYSF